MSADHTDSQPDPGPRNERTFRCPECPRAFNRGDLLSRHRAAHERERAQGSDSTGKGRAGRVDHACDSCAHSKLKCDSTRPCKRCQKKGISCTESTQNGTSAGIEVAPAVTMADVSSDQTIGGGIQDIATSNPSHGLDTGVLEPSSWHSTFDTRFDYNFPSFFQHVMSEDCTNPTPIQAPPVMSNILPELEDWSAASGVFDQDFLPAIEQAIGFTDLSQGWEGSQTTGLQSSGQADNLGTNPSTNNARSRHHILARSPWLHISQSDPNEGSCIDVGDNNIDIGSPQQHSRSRALVVYDRVSSRTRDRIFQMVIKHANSHTAVPMFPSTGQLDVLISVGIARRHESDAWIHPYTFKSESTRSELLIALVAAGCVCFGIPTVSRSGLVLLEIVRVALERSLEEPMDTRSRLQCLQAFMIWLDILGFCGYRQKMQMSESYSLPLITALRRSGTLDKSAYRHIPPTREDGPEGLHLKWQDWIEQESYKRLVYHFFEHDMLISMTRRRQPIMSYAELALPLPASENLWLAPSADLWRATWVDKLECISGNPTPTARSLFAGSERLSMLSKQVDISFATALYVYGLSAEAWEYMQQECLAGAADTKQDPSKRLWLQHRHQYLCKALEDTRGHVNGLSTGTRLMHEFVLMTLHANVDLILRFAGQCGEEEAYLAYEELLSWSKTDTARTAVWHGAQTIRHARTAPPFQLRGADSYALYLVIMVLWAYSMLSFSATRKSGNCTPIGGPSTASRMVGIEGPSLRPEKRVLLDKDERSREIEEFILNNVGRPAIHADADEPNNICHLRETPGILRLGTQLLENNCPGETREGLPPMLKILCDLMDGFAKLK